MERVQWITVLPCLPHQGVGKIESEAGMDALSNKNPSTNVNMRTMH